MTSTAIAPPDAERLAVADGLRELADLIVADDRMAVPNMDILIPVGDDLDVQRAARALDVTVSIRDGMTSASKKFGPLKVQAYILSSERKARFAATTSYDGSVQP